MTEQEARELIAAMRAAVAELPSYVEVQALKAWLENNEEAA